MVVTGNPKGGANLPNNVGAQPRQNSNSVQGPSKSIWIYVSLGVFMFLIVGAAIFLGVGSLKDTSGDASSFSSERPSNQDILQQREVIAGSSCSNDADCLNQYGSDYYCSEGECFFLSDDGGSGDGSNDVGEPVQLLGFFGNFFTGNAAAGAGDAIHYSDGFVGLGTSSPEGMLHVSGGDILLDNNEQLLSENTVGNARNLIYMDNGDTMVIGDSNTSGTDAIRFDIAGIEGVMFIEETTGNLGIGTVSPNGKLQIVNADTGSDLYGLSIDQNDPGNWGALIDGVAYGLDVTGSSWGLRVQSGKSTFAGNVGIGTTSPFTDSSGTAQLTVYDTGLSKITITGGLLNSDESHMPILQLRDEGLNGIAWNIENGRYNAGELGFYLEGVGNKFLIDSLGNVEISSLAGNGVGFVCVYNNGTLHWKGSACV